MTRIPVDFKIVNITGAVVMGSIGNACVMQVTSSIFVGMSNRAVRKSTDGGATWTTKYTYANSTSSCKLRFKDSQGNLYFGDLNPSDAFAKIIRSTDNGDNWTEVCTSESSAWWHMAEDSSGNLYAQEYSNGNGDANELYAYNIWQSTDHGATWNKWHSEPTQSAPGVKDGIRHCHLIACDSSDNLYTSFGDSSYGGNSHHTFRVGSDGTLGVLLSREGNGWISFAQTGSGILLFGSDSTPYRIFRLNKGTGAENGYTVALDIKARFGNSYNIEPFFLLTGKDGVVYALLRGDGATKPSAVLASADEGRIWKLLRYTYDTTITGDSMFVNTAISDSRVLIYASWAGSTQYFTIPDYTKVQLNAL